MNVKVLAEKIPLRNLAEQLQSRGLKLWESLHREGEMLAKMLLKSHLL